MTFLDRTTIPFEGIKKSIKYKNLPNSAFVALGVGKSLQVTVDIALAHDLTSGGLYNVLANSRIPIAKAGTNDIADFVSLTSNNLTVSVDGELARQSRLSLGLLHERALSGFISPNCTPSQAAVVTRALDNCVVYAPWAADNALSIAGAK